MSKEKVLTKDVFTVFENGGGRPTTTVSVFVGLLGSVFAAYGNPLAILLGFRCNFIADRPLDQVPTVRSTYISVLPCIRSFTDQP